MGEENFLKNCLAELSQNGKAPLHHIGSIWKYIYSIRSWPDGSAMILVSDPVRHLTPQSFDHLTNHSQPHHTNINI